MGFIYIIKNTVNDKVYVGQTVNSVENRFKQHKCDVKRYVDILLYKAMRKHGVENFYISEYFEVKDEELNDTEIQTIKKFNSFGKNGYNSTAGGEGGSLYTQEFKEKVIKYALDNPDLSLLSVGKRFKVSSRSIRGWLTVKGNKDHRVKQATRTIICLETGEEFPNAKSAAEFLIAKHSLSENKQKVIYGVRSNVDKKSSTFCGYTFEFKNHISSKKRPDKLQRAIKCIETNTEFRSIEEAVSWLRSNLYPKADASNICNACTGIRKMAYGFNWCYSEDVLKVVHKPRIKPIVCIETNTKFKSIEEAVGWLRLNGFPRSTIANVCAVCLGKRKRAYSYSWKYTDQDHLNGMNE